MLLTGPESRLRSSWDAAQQGRARADASAPLPALFRQTGSVLRLDAGQLLAAEPEHPSSFLVRQGTLGMETTLARRHIALFWHPGDLIEPADLPPLPKAAIRAVAAAELWRLRTGPLQALLADRPDLIRHYRHAHAAQRDRLMIATTMLAALTGEERLASFLVEMALRYGRFGHDGIALEMPVPRADIADHLGLNADTLSRMMTALRESGLVRSHGRRRLMLRDWDALCARTPLAATLIAATAAG